MGDKSKASLVSLNSTRTNIVPPFVAENDQAMLGYDSAIRLHLNICSYLDRREIPVSQATTRPGQAHPVMLYLESRDLGVCNLVWSFD